LNQALLVANSLTLWTEIIRRRNLYRGDRFLEAGPVHATVIVQSKVLARAQ
jgi:hypothetical protein